MTGNRLKKILTDGIWQQNTGLVVLLGLCPLLAVTNTVINGLALGLATMLTLMLSNLSISILRGLLRPEIRIPAFVLIIASVVTVIELLMHAFFYDLYRTLGIFIPLIVTNCAIVARAEIFASRNTVASSILDGLVMGTGFACLLMAIGAFRELLGQGSIFSRMDLLLGGEPVLGIILTDGGWLLMVLPPGAFFSLALAIAAKNAIDRRRREKRSTLSRRPRPLNR
ncbi:MAG: electron transport complex subunit E [Proteobacteria bacterium]|nr:electron transport complex subunit E [Pseudomonadota bacterium]